MFFKNQIRNSLRAIFAPIVNQYKTYTLIEPDPESFMKKSENTIQTTVSLVLAIATLAILIGYLERRDISKMEAIEAIQRLFQSLIFSLIPYFYGRIKDFEMAYSSVIISAYFGLFLSQYLALAIAVGFCVAIYIRNFNRSDSVEMA